MEAQCSEKSRFLTVNFKNHGFWQWILYITNRKLRENLNQRKPLLNRVLTPRIKKKIILVKTEGRLTTFSKRHLILTDDPDSACSHRPRGIPDISRGRGWARWGWRSPHLWLDLWRAPLARYNVCGLLAYKTHDLLAMKTRWPYSICALLFARRMFLC